MSDCEESWIEPTDHPLVDYDALTEAYVVYLDDYCQCEVYGKNRKARAIEIANQQARIEALEKALRTIMNMGFESCREEHRIARKALQETGHE